MQMPEMTLDDLPPATDRDVKRVLTLDLPAEAGCTLEEMTAYMRIVHQAREGN